MRRSGWVGFWFLIGSGLLVSSFLSRLSRFFDHFLNGSKTESVLTQARVSYDITNFVLIVSILVGYESDKVAYRLYILSHF